MTHTLYNSELLSHNTFNPKILVDRWREDLLKPKRCTFYCSACCCPCFLLRDISVFTGSNARLWCFCTTWFCLIFQPVCYTGKRLSFKCCKFFFKVIPLLVCYQRAKVRRKTGIIGSCLCDFLQAPRNLLLLEISFENKLEN